MYEFLLSNQRLKENFASAFANASVPHAILLQGPKGVGKKTAAVYLAASILCETASGFACGLCPSCRKAFASIHPDIVLNLPSGGAKSFHVDTVREMKADAFIAPNESSHKIYIAADIDDMTEAASNAFLKILEEPPPFVIFILTCRESASLLPTILSRCVLFPVSLMSEEDCSALLKKRFPLVPDEKIRRFSALFSGNISLCTAALENEADAKKLLLADEFCRLLVSAGSFDSLAAITVLDKDRAAFLQFLARISLIMGDVCTAKSTSRAPLCGNEDLIAEIAPLYSLNAALQVLAVCEKCKSLVLSNTGIPLISCFLHGNLKNILSR